MASIVHTPSGKHVPVMFLNAQKDIPAHNSLMTGRPTYNTNWLNSETLSSNHTISTTDSGRAVSVNSSGGAVVITLPSTAAYVSYFIMAAADSANSISISPAAADKIVGLDSAGTDDKDLILAAPKKGDYVRLIGDGTDGWYVQEASGTFTRE